MRYGRPGSKSASTTSKNWMPIPKIASTRRKVSITPTFSLARLHVFWQCVGSHGPVGPCHLSQQQVEVVGGADESQVGQRLRKVADQLAFRADLLRKKAQMIGVGEQLFKKQLRLL